MLYMENTYATKFRSHQGMNSKSDYDAQKKRSKYVVSEMPARPRSLGMPLIGDP